MPDIKYFNLGLGTWSDSIETLFPGWEGPSEKICVISPHDDDALLGAGYLILACKKLGATVYVMIVCNGSAGYSDVSEKSIIVERRKQETIRAYNVLGLSENEIIRLDYDDFSVWPFMGRFLVAGEEGSTKKVISTLRRLGITRLVVPNGYREHFDHEASYRIGAYDGPQAGDPIVVDWGVPTVIKNYLQYSVWADFSPEDALATGRSTDIRANRALLADHSFEDTVIKGIKEYSSQARIIDSLVKDRSERDFGEGWVELYLDFDPRPRLNYTLYKSVIFGIEQV